MEFDHQSRNFIQTDGNLIKLRYQIYRNYVMCQTKCKEEDFVTLEKCHKNCGRFLAYGHKYSQALYEQYSTKMIKEAEDCMASSEDSSPQECINKITSTYAKDKLEDFKCEYTSYLERLASRSSI
ncbi:unnamed protein product [Moneuplotes crassus]|uniref:Uncharacterized protein n=1 Tax=Euplotes crassus TaxID=5936 RepID=A0AAD1Y3M9_EUPCR|nr:unnamed protein product [Moneuplotes crassus]